MAIHVQDRLVDAVYLPGSIVAAQGWQGETLFFQAGGVPVVRQFSISPDMVTIGDTGSVSITVACSGVTSGTLTEHLADGTTAVVATQGAAGVDFNTDPGQTVAFQRPRPTQNAHYSLHLTNVDGSVSATATYTYGRRPTIAYFRQAGFRQGISGVTPDSVLLEWSVTGAVPAAAIDIETTRPAGFHFHPGTQQSGSYRYSRQGAGAETLTLTAGNTFGGVSQTLAIDWPASVHEDPAPPQSISSSASGRRITTSWTAPTPSTGRPSASTYNGRYRLSGTMTWTTVTGVTSPWVISTGLEYNMPYEVQVQSVAANGALSAWSATQNIRTGRRPRPPVPANIRLTVSGNVVSGSFSPAANADGYGVRYRPVGTQRYQSQSLTTTTFSFTGAYSTTYEVQVYASGPGGASPWSAVHTVSIGRDPATILNPPTGLSATFERTAFGGTDAVASWRAPTSGLTPTSYDFQAGILRSSTFGDTYSASTRSTTTTSYRDRNINPLLTYFYRVRSRRGSSTSAWVASRDFTP